MTEIAALGLKVEGVQDIDQASSSLDRFTKASESAEKSADALGKSSKESGDRFKALAQATLDQKAALDAEVRAALESANANRKMSEGWREATKAQTELLSAEHKAREASKRHEAQMRATAEAAERNRRSLQRLLEQIDPLERSLNRLDDLELQLTATFKQGAVDVDTYASAMAKLTSQRNDVVTRQMRQLEDGARGASEYIRRLGLNSAQSQRDVISLGRAVTRGDWMQASSSALNLSRSTGLMSSSFMVAAGAAGVAALSVAGLAIAWSKGREESEEFTKTLILTGNAAGTSTDQLMTMAARVGDMVGTQRRAAAALNELAQTANIGARDFERFAETALRWEDATGTAASEVVREFEEIGRSPVEAMNRLDRSMNFLTESTREQIETLVSQGREIEAAKILQHEYADVLDERAPQIVERLGWIEKGWRAIKKEAAEVVSGLLDIGRPATTLELLIEAENRLKQLDDGARRRGAARRSGGYDEQQNIVYALQGQLALEESLNAIRQDGIALQGQRNEAEKNFSAYVDERLTRDEQRARDQDKEAKAYESRLAEQKRLLESGLVDESAYRKQVERIEAAHQTALKNIRDKYKDKQSGGISTTQTELAGLKAAIEAERQREESLHSLTEARGNLNNFERQAIQYGEKLKLTTDQKVRAQLKENKALAEQAGAMKRANDAFEKESKERESAIAAAERQTETLRDQIATYGLGKSAIEEMTIARLEERLAMADPAVSDATIDGLRRELEVRRALLDAMRTKESLDAQLREWQAWEREVDRIFNQLGQSLTDQLFEGGKSARDAIRDLFKNLVLRVAIQPVMGALQGMVTNQLGGLLGYQNPAQQQAGGGGFGFGGGGGFEGLSKTLYSAGERVGSYGLQNFAAGLNNYLPTSVSSGFNASASLGTGSIANPSFSASMGGGGSSAGNAGQWLSKNGATVLTAASAIYDISQGNYFRAAGTVAGSFLPIPGGQIIGNVVGGLLDDVFGGGLPTTRRSQQGASHMLPDGSFEVAQWDSRQSAASQEAARDFAQSAVKSADELFKRIGVDAQIYSFMTLMESSILGDKQGVGSSGKVRVGDEIIDIGLAVESSWTKHGVGGWSDAEMLPRLQADIQLTLLEAFQAAGDSLPNVLSGMLEGVDIRSLGAEEAQALAQTFGFVVEQVTGLQEAVERLPFAQLRDLSFDAAANLIQFAGSLEALDAGMTSYFQNFYNEAEQLEWLSSQISGALGELGLVMPDVAQGADEAKSAWRSIVESLDLTTEEGQRAYATMMTLSGGFAELATGMEQLGQSAGNTASRFDSLINSFMGMASDALSAVQQRGQEQIAKLSESFARTDTVFNAYRSQVQQLESQWGSLITTMERSMRDLRGQVEASARLQYDQARSVISTALVTGQLPQTADLSEAIRIAQQGVGARRYASAFDQRSAYLTLANELEALQGIAQPELDTARASLEQLEKQYNRLRGIEDLSGLSLTALERQLGVALAAEESARVQIAGIERQISMAQLQYQQLVGINDELSTLPGALNALAKAIGAASAVREAAGQGASSGVSREAQYLANNPDVLQAYLVDSYGLAADEFARMHYERHGKREGRSFDVGTSYVPYDMMANIHKGEIIVNPRDSDILRRYGIGLNVQGGVGQSRATEQLLREQLAETRQQNRYLYELVKSGKRTAMNTEDSAMALAHNQSDDVVVVF